MATNGGRSAYIHSDATKSQKASRRIYARRALRRCRGHSALGTPGTRRARAHIIATGSERRLRAADDAPHHHCMCCDFLVLLLAFALATRLSGCLHHQPCGMVVQQEVVRAVLWLGSPLAPLLRASPGAHAALLVTCCACYQIEWLLAS